MCNRPERRRDFREYHKNRPLIRFGVFAHSEVALGRALVERWAEQIIYSRDLASLVTKEK